MAKLIDRMQQLETQVATLGRVQSRMEAAQRESLETMERFEVGQLRAGDAGRRRGLNDDRARPPIESSTL